MFILFLNLKFLNYKILKFFINKKKRILHEILNEVENYKK